MREEKEVTPSQVGAVIWEDGGVVEVSRMFNLIKSYFTRNAYQAGFAGHQAGGLPLVFNIPLHAARRAMAAAPPLPKQRRWLFYISYPFP